MKNYLCILFILMGISQGLGQKNEDLWSGKYELIITQNGKTQVADTIIIKKIDDAKAEKLTLRYRSDLARWSITSVKEPNEKEELRRFLFDLKNKRNEYEDFGWTALHQKGKMNCVDAVHFFICQTMPNTEVLFRDEEKYFTKTGIFGIRLHYGAFELKKIMENPSK